MDCFQAVVLSDELGLGCWKPSPAPYRKMLAALAVPAGDALYVADNPAKDFVAARKAGWWTVQVRRPEGQYHQLVPQPGYEAHFVIDSLLELFS
jgi:putative hydrolase of the HAD superfamily